MGTTEDAERRIITELTQLLRKNADKLLSGETKLCLTTSSLGIIAANFRRVSDLTEEDERRELEGRGLITSRVNGRLKKKVEDIKIWRDNIRTLQDFVIKTQALKIIHGTYTIRAPVQIARFHSLQVLEVKKVPIHMVEGLSKLRGQLREIIVTRSLQKLQDLFEICGGDRSSGLNWQNLKTANLGFNGLSKLDNSLDVPQVAQWNIAVLFHTPSTEVHLYVQGCARFRVLQTGSCSKGQGNNYVPFLEVCDLSHNSIQDTEDCLRNLTDLLRINLGFNQLTKVPQFSSSTKVVLKTLVLRNNSLDNIEGIEELTALEELDLAHNLLVDHQCLVAVSKLKKLMILCLTGNPLTYKWNHRTKTVEYLSPTIIHGVFLLDGLRLSAQETSLLKESQFTKSFKRESNSSVIVEEVPCSGNNVFVDNVDSSGSVDNTRLSVKRKKGHKRVGSKSRTVVIADIEDSQVEESAVESGKTSPTGSYVEDPKELERIESEKRKYEIMREHYKDDWLKALLADQGRLSVDKTEEQSEEAEEQSKETEEQSKETEEQSKEGGITKKPNESNETVIVTDNSKIDTGKTEKEAKTETKQQAEKTEVAEEMKKKETESVLSPPITEISPTTDIYALRQAAPLVRQTSTVKSPDPVVHSKGVEWGRSESQQEEYYGEESAPFIVMLPDQDMKQMFITVNDRYITEKNLNGQKCEMLDLKCLQSKKLTEEPLSGRDIIGRVLMPVVTLDFDYIRKDMRQRKYAMEDDDFAKEFEALIEKHIRAKELQTQMKELVECLKCQHQFFKPQKTKTSSPILQCPKCKSKMVIELNIRKFDHESTKESPAGNLSVKEKLATRHSINISQASPTFHRKRAIKKSEESSGEINKSEPAELLSSGYGSLPSEIVPQMREKSSEDRAERHRSFRTMQFYEEYDTFQDNLSALTSASSTAQSQMKPNKSWSDVRTSGSHSVPRGSVSSVESDITILATNSSKGSVAVVSESNQDVSTAGNQTFATREPAADHVTDGKEADLQRNSQVIITPVGSPLSNSVCSSMVSSVYENTLPGEGENVQDTGSNVLDNDLTGSFTGSVSKNQTSEDQSEHFSNESSSHSAMLDSDIKVILTSGESISVYDTADSTMNKSFDKSNDISNSVDKSDRNSSIPSIYDSVTSESDPRTSSPDDQNNPNKSVIRRTAPSRRSFKKRSGYYGIENFESSSEVNENNKGNGLNSADKLESSSEVNNTSASGRDRTSLQPDFPLDISPIKRRSKNRNSNREHRSAVLLDSSENLTGDESLSADVSRSSALSFEADVSSQDQEEICHSPPAIRLPWEQEESSTGDITDGVKHESFNHDEFVNVDHRLQLYLELKVFSSSETCQCVLHCNVVQYMKPDAIKSLLVISTNRILLYEVIGDINSDSASDWLKCYEDQPITELQFVDVGLGYQSLRLEFGTDCSSYSLLIMDEGRCKRFLTLLTGIVQSVSMNEHSKLEGISKSDPTTQENLETQVLNMGAEPQELVKYLLVQLLDSDDSDKRDTRGLVITLTDIILVSVNHQWPLPRLQAPLSPNVKGQQFIVIQKEHINNIETLEFNEYNPTELRVSFFDEGSEEKIVWVMAMETTLGVKALVDAIREPWEQEFGVSFDITPVSFSEGEQN